MKQKVNYVIATWSGNRYNPSKDYLKVHIKRLFELKHNLDQITIVRPLGSDNDEYYNINIDILTSATCPVIIINRPANDRSYGQFIYAYQQNLNEGFTHQICVEDDYVPNIDNFDSILVDMIEDKDADYLCGKYAKQTNRDRDRAIQNQGIVRTSSFKKMLDRCNPIFPPMGPEDGTEQLIFSEYFTDNGMIIRDYANEYSIPYWAKTLMYFSEKRGFETIFVPYQCIVLDKDSHFLSTVKYTPFRKESFKGLYGFNEVNSGDWFIIQEPQIDLYPHNGKDVWLGFFKLHRDIDGKLSMHCHSMNEHKHIDLIMYERISWENRGENLYIWMNVENELFEKLKSLKWEVCENAFDSGQVYVRMFKDYRNW